MTPVPENVARFERETRETIAQILNQLHTANLRVAALEAEILSTGEVVQGLSHSIETFIDASRQPPDETQV